MRHINSSSINSSSINSSSTWRASLIRMWCRVCDINSSSMSRQESLHLCHVPRSYVWLGLFIRVTHTSLVHTCDTQFFAFMWRGVLACVTCLVHLCDITCSYVCHHLRLTCSHGTWLVHARDIAPWYVCLGLLYAAHDMFTCVSCLVITWHVHMCDLPCWYMSHDLFMYVTWLVHTCIYSLSNLYCGTLYQMRE